MKYLIDAYVEVEGDSPDEAVRHFHLGEWLGRVDIMGVDEIKPRLIIVGNAAVKKMES